MNEQGFTLTELMFVVAIVAILLAAGIPSLTSLIERHRLQGAVTAVYDDLQYARSQAIRQGTPIYATFNAGSDWCVGIDDQAPCNCQNANDCQVKGVDKVTAAKDYDGVNMPAVNINGGVNYMIFDPRRGAPEDSSGALRNGNVDLQSQNGDTVTVSVNVIGIIDQCSDDSGGYPSC